MKKLITITAAVFLITTAHADSPTAEQRRALALMYDIESIQSHCLITINFEKIDSDLSAIGLSIADYCPDGRFNAFAMPDRNESMSGMMARLKGDKGDFCRQADRRFGSKGFERMGWLSSSIASPKSLDDVVPLCTLDRP